MGLYDRDYTQENYRPHFGRTPPMRMGSPRLTPVVKKLLIINVAVFMAGIIVRPLGVFIYNWFQLDATHSLQLWRLITYQFLHDPNSIGHILYNMLVLFFLGPILERHWGGRKFLPFYLGCGVAGGMFYLFLVSVGFFPAGNMVGASGAVLGVLAACAILFPSIVILLFFIFPVSIRAVAAILTLIAVVGMFTGKNAGGEAAHLAGMAAGAFYVFSQAWWEKTKVKTRKGAWQKKMATQQQFQMEVDRILQKVHHSGIKSLTTKEKRILKKATNAEQRKNI